MKLTALIDGDILTYAVGSFTNPHPFLKDKEGKPLQMPCTTEAIKGFALDEVNRITDKAACKQYKLFISGPNNFRNDIAKTHPYKFKRADLDKPYHYQTVKDFYVNELGAIVTDGIEADDALAIAQTSETVICSVDKDLLMVPGMHYNWRREEFRTIDYQQGVANFLYQLLVGDWATDSIIGCGHVEEKVYGPKAAKAGQRYLTRVGIGPKGAYNILENTDPNDWLGLVVAAYQQEFGDNWKVMLNEMANLLCMGLDANNLWDYDERSTDFGKILGHLVKESVNKCADNAAEF